VFSKNYWQSSNYQSLRIEEWNGEFTLFQPDSGKTHFLNQMGLQIILILDQSPASEDEVCLFLKEQFQLKPDQNFSRQIIKTLHRFDELGLIEKVKL
jgi:PqqD family protein of HPr-rel-A system